MPKSSSDRSEQAIDEDAEHQLQINIVDRRYALMRRELENALGIIDALDVPDNRKEQMRQITRDKLSRKYFGDEIFSMN